MGANMISEQIRQSTMLHGNELDPIILLYFTFLSRFLFESNDINGSNDIH